MTNTETPPRRTRQRALIDDVLADTDQWLTAQHVHQLLVHRGQPVGLTTVYRTLTAMADRGQIDVARSGQEVTYRLCSKYHHHHLTCRNCGRAVEISATPLEDWATAVASQHGYTSVEHTIEISGLCPACA